MITTYEARGIERRIVLGIEEGTLRAKRDDVLRLTRLRFGAVSGA